MTTFDDGHLTTKASKFLVSKFLIEYDLLQWFEMKSCYKACRYFNLKKIQKYWRYDFSVP
jgi:hypothetical protein